MSPRLADIFGELGISQYLDAFVDQGFDTWETILDITESDLDALGVKLGHRRKLQRRIANARGIAPTATLVSPTQANVEDTRNDAHRPDAHAPSAGDGRDGGTQPVVQKRKYRRHPKPDQNAPERPPSAYVLFSNKMREDLKGQNLTFTEIAKLVGENWQGLTHTEKEPFERQAQTAKEKFTHDLAEYKKTPAYQKYLVYLQEFKAKYGDHKPQEPTASSGEPPARRRRIDSLVSNGESCYAPSVASASQRTPGEESNLASPTTGYFERRREPSPGFAVSPKDNSSQPPSKGVRIDPMYADGPRPRPEPAGPLRHLPSLSDMFDGRPVQNGMPSSYPGEAAVPTFTILPRGYQTNSPALTPSTSGSESRPPSLMKDQSAGSMSSGSGSSSYNSYPRTPIEGSLPIHALLTGGGAPPISSNSTASPPTPGPGGKGDAGLDGISALLQADKISDRRLV
ncbi:hypothetical protein M406DRAFT_340462 [Cryphonectria parasitica EP155]|uniref:HMG box domain-containing protein n=1 Tax=Cryphonectria parasitica (strain ATCC 38755 / EP155) TaxID=660469 RepID=A0A9P4Y1J3_CRYP1|nr:uncharacterized protein M406DRAFT_340462 [Cryphonectria parasitica EP155]KAF3764953.1 hypothetical protein M406DRAFT_340462 [Cryphonectria parasitica EP155]